MQTLDGISTLLSEEGKNQLFIISVYEDERPLRGTVGLLDWRFRGQVSRLVQSGKIQGYENEFTYLPVKFHKETRHLLLIGLGSRAKAKDHSASSDSKLIQKLSQTIENLGFKKALISQSCFPFITKQQNRESIFPNIEVGYVK